MKRSRFTDEQIAYALRQAESGTPVPDVCRQLVVYPALDRSWRRSAAAVGAKWAPLLSRWQSRLACGTRHVGLRRLLMVTGGEYKNIAPIMRRSGRQPHRTAAHNAPGVMFACEAGVGHGSHVVRLQRRAANGYQPFGWDNRVSSDIYIESK